jgi:hypothetical protein
MRVADTIQRNAMTGLKGIIEREKVTDEQIGLEERMRCLRLSSKADAFDSVIETHR